MSLPCYKIINVNSHEQRMIFAQLTNIKFNDVPIVLNIEHLKEHQTETIEFIDEYFQLHSLEELPYSVYIIGFCPYYTGELYVVEDKNKLPQFFNQKTKILNVKENTIIKKVHLKKQNFNAIKKEQYQPILKEYARTHKVVANLQQELQFLKKIGKDLEGYYDKQEK